MGARKKNEDEKGKILFLFKGGEDVVVTNENKNLYLDTYRHYLLEGSIKTQLDAFVAGFKILCDGKRKRTARMKNKEEERMKK